MLLAISAVVDNWWDGNILPHFEKPGSTPVSTYILDSYRIRNTDKHGNLPIHIISIRDFW